jgi:hypothetical protein
MRSLMYKMDEMRVITELQSMLQRHSTRMTQGFDQEALAARQGGALERFGLDPRLT